MKNSINCMKNSIAKILIVSIILAFSTMPVFATTYPDTQSPTSLSWYVEWQNTSHSIYRGESIGEILANIARWNDMGMNAIYQRMGGLSGDIQDVVDAIGAIPGATDYSSILNSIDGKIKDYTNNFASVENKLQSMINNLINLNTGVTSINTSLGTGTSSNNVLSNLASIISGQSSINSDTTSIKTILSRQYYNTIYSPSLWSNGVASVSQFATPRSTAWVPNSDNTNIRMGFTSTASVNNPLDYLAYMNSNLFNISLLFRQAGKYYNVDVYDYDNDSVTKQGIISLFDWFEFGFNPMNEQIHRLGYVFADDDTIAHKIDNKPQEESILDNFTGSGDASASVSDIGTAKDTLVGVKSGLNTGTSASQIIGVFNNDEGYNWFSNAVAQDINPSNTRSNGSKGYSTPLLDEKMNALYSVMGVKHD